MDSQRQKEEIQRETRSINWDYLWRISPGLFLWFCGALLLGFLIWAQVEFGIYGFLRDSLFG